MRFSAWSFVLLFWLLSQRAMAQPGWVTHFERTGPFSFSCPPSWTYEGKGVLDLYYLNAPAGSAAYGPVTIAVSVYPGDRQLLEKQADDSTPDPVDKNKTGTEIPTLKWQGWRTAFSGRVYERALDCILAADGSHYLRLYRYLQVDKNLLCLVASVPEPYTAEQLKLLQAVLDSFRAQASLYEQLKI